jgi:hypothetical protein
MTKIPWYIWLSVVGVTSAMIGGHWDISWHRSIGRDTFWTAPHLAIQLCGVIAGITCGYLILWTTFANSQLRGSSANMPSVSVFGFRGPLGAFICAWGGFTMITSAPFDDWWHNAYGLDVKILSPPHVVLVTGLVAVQIGAMVLIAAGMNRSSGETRRNLKWLFLYVTSMILVELLTAVLELTNRSFLHTAVCYRAICIVAPLVLAIGSRATGLRWAATTVAALYTAFILGLLWILPLFPAQPKLGPVMSEVKQFVPPDFPLLVLIPALVLDLIGPITANWSKWRQALVSGVLFFAALVTAEWPFADFLQSPAARNAFFGSIYLSYFQSPQSYGATYRFVPYETAAQFRIGMAIALACAIASAWLGMGAGDWLKRVRR